MSGRPSLRPFTDHTCAACGSTCPTLTYCEHICWPGIQGAGGDAFVDATTVGDECWPHLHVACSHCRCEWLTECKPKRAERP